MLTVSAAVLTSLKLEAEWRAIMMAVTVIYLHMMMMILC